MPEPDPWATLGAGVLLYGMITTVALVWLHWRDRMGALAPAAIGDHGPLAASGLGLAVGWSGAMVIGWLASRVRRLREHEDIARRLFHGMGDGWLIAFVMLGAVGEELLFRLAVQDALGLVGSVAIYALLHSSMVGFWFLPFAVLHALCLGLIVEQGFGLLGSTTAHSILNYLSLRRILCA